MKHTLVAAAVATLAQISVIAHAQGSTSPGVQRFECSVRNAAKEVVTIRGEMIAQYPTASEIPYAVKSGLRVTAYDAGGNEVQGFEAIGHSPWAFAAYSSDDKFKLEGEDSQGASLVLEHPEGTRGQSTVHLVLPDGPKPIAPVYDGTGNCKFGPE